MNLHEIPHETAADIRRRGRDEIVSTMVDLALNAVEARNRGLDISLTYLRQVADDMLGRCNLWSTLYYRDGTLHNHYDDDTVLSCSLHYNSYPDIHGGMDIVKGGIHT